MSDEITKLYDKYKNIDQKQTVLKEALTDLKIKLLELEQEEITLLLEQHKLKKELGSDVRTEKKDELHKEAHFASSTVLFSDDPL